MSATPRCSHCGYDLTGLRVDGHCPECGQAIWSRAPASEADRVARNAQVLGIVSLVLCVACLGPLAVVVAIPALLQARRFSVMTQGGTFASAMGASAASIGRVCAWICVGLSIVAVALYAAMFGAALLGV